ncbi:MAG: TIR domain-containing protein [Chloroflexi bacterium]|nr:TIR domain-containing protein [Chloroflexota bacterium]
MAGIFISYSRKDQAFVRQLHAALVKANHDVWVDWEDIPLTAEWLAEIYDGIEKADTFLAVLSPEYLVSESCKKEVTHAVKNNKRLVPIVRRDVVASNVPKALADLNWLYFRESDAFATKFDDLNNAIHTDLDWARAHTRLLVRAIEWDSKKRNGAFLLRGADLRAAEKWLAQAPAGKEPKPTPLQGEYILLSRQWETRQQRIILSAVLLALFVTIVLAVIAVVQSNEATIQKNAAINNEATAVAERNIAQSRELAAAAVNQLDVDPERSILLALEAERAASTQQSAEALQQALRDSRVRIVLDGGNGTVSAAYSRSGKLILTADEAWTAQVWDASSGKLNATLVAKPIRLSYYSSFAAFSHNERLVASATPQQTVGVWDVATGNQIRTLRGHTSVIYKAIFSPDDKYILTASGDKTARLWNASNGEQVFVLEHAGLVHDVAFNSTGTRAATGAFEQTARVWDLTNRKELYRLGKHVWGVDHVAFSPDDKYVVTVGGCSALGGCDNIIRLWNSENNQFEVEKPITELSGHTSGVTDVAFSRDGKYLVSGSQDNTARVWAIPGGATISVLRGHTGKVRAVAISPDGKRVATASEDGTARLWDTLSGIPLAIFRGHTDYVWNVAFSPDGKSVLTGSRDGTARVWMIDFDIPQTEWREKETTSPVLRVTSSPDQSLVLFGRSTATLWETQSGRYLTSFQHSQGSVVGMSFTPDSRRILTIGNDETVLIGDLTRDASGRIDASQRLVKLSGAPQRGWRIGTFSPDGSLVMMGNSEGVLHTWDVTTGKFLADLVGHTDILTDIQFSLDGKRVVTGSWDDTVRVWNPRTGENIATMRGHSELVRHATFSPDGRRIVSASTDNTARVWNAETGEQIAWLFGHADDVNDAIFSPDGQTIVTASQDGTARLWETSTGRNLAILRGHTGAVTGATYSSDGKYLVTFASPYFAGTGDSSARVWKADSGLFLGELYSPSGYVSAAAFSADARSVVTVHSDGFVRIFPCELCVSIEALKTLAQRHVTRELSCDEKRTFLYQALGCPTPVATPTYHITCEDLKAIFGSNINCSALTPTVPPTRTRVR